MGVGDGTRDQNFLFLDSFKIVYGHIRITQINSSKPIPTMEAFSPTSQELWFGSCVLWTAIFLYPFGSRLAISGEGTPYSIIPDSPSRSSSNVSMMVVVVQHMITV